MASVAFHNSLGNCLRFLFLFWAYCLWVTEMPFIQQKTLETLSMGSISHLQTGFEITPIILTVLFFFWGCPNALSVGVWDSQDPYPSGVGEVTRFDLLGPVPRGQPSPSKDMHARIRSHGPILPSYKSPRVLRTTALKVIKVPPHPVQFFSLFSPLCPSLPWRRKS